VLFKQLKQFNSQQAFIALCHLGMRQDYWLPGLMLKFEADIAAAEPATHNDCCAQVWYAVAASY
jgi:hypothetical protein